MSDSRAHRSDVEASILGGIILRNDTLAELPLLEVDDFEDWKHKVVFSAMRNLEAKLQPIDVVTLGVEIERQGKFDAIGGYAFLGELAVRVPIAENAIHYAREVRDWSLSRRVVDACARISSIAEGCGGAELLSEALAMLSAIDAEQPEQSMTIAKLANKRLRQLEDIAAAKLRGDRALTGFPTGVARLDEKLGGLQAGIVTIVAARPGMGKSSLGLAIADACSTAGFGVHVFSLEDTEESYADRMLARTSEVPAENLRNLEINREQMADVTNAMYKLRGKRWLVDGRSGISAEEIVRSVRRSRRQNATNVVIVDYVQLVKRAPRLSAHDALTEIVTTLADAAKHDRMSYVVMSQLNRSVEQRQDKRPQLSDLRESGSLEERAKCVIGLYRGAYYGDPIESIDYSPKWKERQARPSPDDHEREVQLHVLKNSNGRTGSVWANWHGPTTRVS